MPKTLIWRAAEGVINPESLRQMNRVYRQLWRAANIVFCPPKGHTGFLP